MSPKTIYEGFLPLLNAFEEALNSNDVERVVDLFTDNGILALMPPPFPLASSVFVGKDQIREWFEPQLRNLKVSTFMPAPGGPWRRGHIVPTFDVTSDLYRDMEIEPFKINATIVPENDKILLLALAYPDDVIERIYRAHQAGRSHGVVWY